MTDRLSLTNALADADIDRQKAERIATEIFDAIHDNVATKQDLQRLEAAVKSDIVALRLELKADIARVEQRLDVVEHRLLIRLGGLIVAAAGIMLAVLRYWLPHG
jgi:hypothetical protein